MVTIASRTKPRISVNKLAEYLVASPRRRRSIIEDQRTPKPFKVARYTEALGAIARYIIGGATDLDCLRSAIARLKLAVPSSEWDENRIKTCVEAIEAAAEIDFSAVLHGMVPESGLAESPYLSIHGVDVSVRPEVILTGRDRTGKSIIGAVKLCISKTSSLTTETGAYVGCVVHQFVEERLSHRGNPDYRFCFAVDVFARKIHRAPKAVRMRRSDVTAGCSEIALGWVA
jgi:hypothetical protein